MSPRAAWERTRQTPSFISRGGAEKRTGGVRSVATDPMICVHLCLICGSFPSLFLSHAETQRRRDTERDDPYLCALCGKNKRIGSRLTPLTGGTSFVATAWGLSDVACRAGGRVSPRAAWERTRQTPSFISRGGAEERTGGSRPVATDPMICVHLCLICGSCNVSLPYPCFCSYHRVLISITTPRFPKGVSG